jgi:hypothetical protein
VYHHFLNSGGDGFGLGVGCGVEVVGGAMVVGRTVVVVGGTVVVVVLELVDFVVVSVVGVGVVVVGFWVGSIDDEGSVDGLAVVVGSIGVSVDV